jgi:hypothetical protein
MSLIIRIVSSARCGQLKVWCCAALLCLCAVCTAGAGVGANILTDALTVEQVGSYLLPASRWHPFPQLADRDRWASLPAEVRNGYIREAEKHLHGTWLMPKATDFLGFVRTGNRSEYQAMSFGRRQQLATLVIAECIEGKGRFRDDIVNGIWTICEESYWGVPAHVGMQRRGSGLPDVSEPTVDLFAAETGSLLAWTYYLLKDSLDPVSPLVCERITYEVDRRINAVNLDRNDLWWMGLTEKRVNNWTPWICSNWLATVLVLEQDPERRAGSVYKIMQCLDRFLDEYTDDGGCDEGPSYWGRAGGSLFDCLELMHSATRGKLSWYTQPRIREIGRFITRAHISGSWFVNFADAPARLRADAPTVYRFGKAIGDAPMMDFGAWIARDQHLGEGVLPGHFGVLGRVLPALFVLDELLKVNPSEPYFRDSWFPGIQVMTARSIAGSANGLFLAAQGGHNDESHNHNDVGNFIVYKNGEPAIIDIGVETYTAKTFSPDRYSIWTMQSGYHNLPTINGITQKEGKKFAAKDVAYHVTDAKAALSMDIAGAYPPEAGVKSWHRIVSLERGKEISVQDTYELSSVGKGISVTLMACREPIMSAAGTILLGPPSGSATATPVEITYDAALFSVHAEPIDIRDPQLQSSWGEKLWRIVLTMKQTVLKNVFVVRVS